uniref:Dedicator of cytokinesis protein 7 n=1 Tax=Plectus sambesii TaxID=2011161 RepID=A0A914X6L0_9BILA
MAQTPSGGAQRAFAQKRNKMLASEVRRHVMTGSLAMHPVPSAPSSLSLDLTDAASQASVASLNLFDVVEPVDIEECLIQRKTSALYDQSGAGSSPRRLSDFPPDDVEVRVVRRDRPTVDSPISVDLNSPSMDGSVKDLIMTYTDDLSLVQRRYHQFSSGEAYLRQCVERPIVLQTIPRQLYEVETERRRRSASVGDDDVSKRASYASHYSSDSTSTVDSSSIARDEPQQQLHQSVGDPTVSGVTQRTTPAQMDQANESRRQSGRHATLMNLLPLQAESDVIERRSPPPFPVEHSGQKLLARVLHLSVEPDFEPIFGQMALYDVKERRKVSETFHFDANSDSIRTLIKGEGQRVDEASMCRQALFSVTYPSNDLFIVIKLEKVLQACDISDAADPYIKEDRNREKLAASARDYCERLGAYRMPLAWTAIDLAKVLNGASTLERNESMTTSTITASSAGTLTPGFSTDSVTQSFVYPSDTDSIISVDRQSSATTGTFKRVGSGTGSLRCRTPLGFRSRMKTTEEQPINFASLRPVTLTVNNFFRQESDRLSEDDLFKFLAEARKPGSLMKRLKCVPINLKLEVSGVVDDLPMRLTPELLRLHPFVPSEESPLTRELTEFPLREVYAVNCSYRNLLYVYPKMVNFSNRPGTARNIALRVQLLDGKERPLPAIFGKSYCPNFSTAAYTAVSYHNKCPQFADEMKVQLPVDLNDGHHLLFTFYHVACKPTKSNEDVETPVGYTWIPLYKDGRLQTGDFNLPISLEKLPTSYCYLSPEVNLPNVKWLDGHKPVFSVTLEAATTLHTQDDHLDAFIRQYHALLNGKRVVNETDLKLAIQNLTKARPEPLVRYLYVVLDKLLDLLVNPPFVGNTLLNVAPTCFEMLGQLVKILTYLLDGFCDSHGRSSLLTTYIHYHKIANRDPPNGHYATAPSTNYRASRNRRTSSSNPDLNSPDGQDMLLDIIKGFEKSASVRADSVADDRTGCGRMMHEELALQWVVSNGSAREMACLNAWFFFELMIKAMAEYLASANRLYLPRKLRFSDQFVDDVTSLCAALTSEVVSRAGKDPRQAHSINSSLAFFLRDAFSLMDRSYVMSLVKSYNKQLTAKIVSLPESACTLMLLKLDFVRIIGSHEHSVVLNLPFGIGMLPPNPQLQPPSPSSSLSSRSTAGDSHGSIGAAELTPDFRARHFLVGLALADLAAVLDTANAVLHARAVGLLRNCLAAIDADARIVDGGVKTRVAALYLPLVGIVLDACTQLYDPYARSPSAAAQAAASARSFTGSGAELLFGGTSGPGVNPKIALAIAGMGVSPPQSPPPELAEQTRRPTLTFDTTRQLLACFCWTLKNMDRQVLRHWLRDLSPNRVGQFLDVLQLCISCFEYKPSSGGGGGLAGGDSGVELKQKLEDAILGPNSSAKELLRSKKMSGELGTPGGVRWRKEQLHQHSWKSTCSAEDRPSAILPENESLIEANLATEIALVVLDALELVVKVVSAPGADHLIHVLPTIVRIEMHMLACNQSVLTLENLFASQRALTAKYPELLFEQETEQCGELCLQLLRHCASRLPAVRSQAGASLYLLMRQSFESGANLSKVKMQITMSLSTLVSNGTRLGLWLNEDYLRRSLKTVLTYAEMDASADAQLRQTTFAEQVKDLVFNLYMILSDTVKMKEFANDFEMLVDLMYRVAKGYQTNPDLRLTWLVNMASKHAERENFAEAGQCMLHASALAAEYVSMTDNAEHLPKGAVAFVRLSDNILEESAVSDDVISPDEEGICESRHFSEHGLVFLVEQTANFLEKAQMYEAMDWVYKVITPILEEWRDYRRLAQIHCRLSEALARVEQNSLSGADLDAGDVWCSSSLPSTDKRCFGTFFRVGFYGARFGDLDGQEFIYKEPAITKLAEISHRLEAFYAERFEGKVEIIKDSNTVDRTRLNSDRAYLQITYVEPYLERWERRRRPTHFERNFKLNRFVYATPFTKDGRAHGDLKDQYKRRTVLTTAHSFPYMKTRLGVVHRTQTTLTPIEVAIEDIQKKTCELGAATALHPPDAKMLQMVLQGCVGTTVNQGPMEIANVFLTDLALDSRGKPTDKLQNKLRLCFKDFSKKCADALQKNRQLIQADQQAYQNELQRNYIEFTKRMAPIVGTAAVGGGTLKRHHKHDRKEQLLSASASDEFGPVSAV